MLANSLYIKASGSGGGIGDTLGSLAIAKKGKMQADTVPNNVFKLVTINFVNKWERVDLETVRGDRLFPYRFLLQVDGVGYDLTKRNIHLGYRKQGSPSSVRIINGQPLAAPGEVMFLAGLEDFTEAGTFEWDLSAYKISGRPQTFAKGVLTITDDINKL